MTASKEGRKTAIANKSIEVWTEYDPAGFWTLRIRKKRGKLSLEEIKEACIDYEQDFYLLIIKALDDCMEQYYMTDDLDGDYVVLYRADDFFAWRNK